MKLALLALAALSIASGPAMAQSCGDDGKYFHLTPPSYSVPNARKQAIHRQAKAMRWYKEHMGDKPLCQNNRPM
ncbi:MAG: hypothetical protein HY711_05430 [Candidatus Melainabacteria bacterium]|nr:hypothetical protein [Candidatus Melainabacteria bacterium]